PALRFAREARLLGDADGREPQVEQHHRGAFFAQRIAVQAVMLRVEELAYGFPVPFVRNGNVDLVILTEIAQVHADAQALAASPNALAIQRLAGLRGHLGEQRLDARVWTVRQGLGEAAHVVVLEVGAQHPSGAEDRRIPRHHDAPDAQLGGDRGAVDRPRAARADERKLARIVALLHRDLP